MAAPKGNGLAANVNDPMAAGGMAATDVTQASEQAKSREFLTKHQFKEAQDGCHAIKREGGAEACGREGGCGGKASPAQER